ncbi:glycosyltransferase family 4 protein [Bacteroidales bacterium OttesenSCG-928-A17]|nr:glycosyltransferase family 4 protein [Bacteroidales bacterium OttesenSCG-928-A17]
MRIVALHTDFRLYWPARLKKLSSDLEQRGDELTVVEISGKGSPYSFASKETNADLNWICLFPNERMEDLNPKEAKTTVLQKLDKLMPDAILSGSIAFSSGAAAVDWAKRNDKAVVIFDDSKLEDVPRNFIVNSVKKIIYSNVDAVLCPAEDWLNTFRFWGFKKEAVFFGEDVVDNQFWTRKTTGTQELPDRYFLAVGRQIERKNFIVLLNAFYLFRKNNPDSTYELVLVGDGPERKELEKRVPEEIKNKVHFFNFKEQEELREIYQRASVFILPSLSEQWGLVVNEAMAAGLPVIVSKQCGCASSLVSENQNGFLFNAGDTEQLVAVLQKINKLKDLELKNMGKKSQEIISQWDLDRFSKGAIDAVYYAVNNRRKPFYFLAKFLLNKWNGRYNQG